jgi:ribosomal protein L31
MFFSHFIQMLLVVGVTVEEDYGIEEVSDDGEDEGGAPQLRRVDSVSSAVHPFYTEEPVAPSLTDTQRTPPAPILTEPL